MSSYKTIFLFLILFLIIKIKGQEQETPIPNASSTTDMPTSQQQVTTTTAVLPPPPTSLVTPISTSQPLNNSTLPVTNSTLHHSVPSIPVSASLTKVSTTPLPAAKQTTTTTKKKIYPQTEFEKYPDELTKDENYEQNFMIFLYIASATLSTGFIAYATYILYRKGLGDEAQAARTWENTFDDDGYRNKSTISRNTITPSISNSTPSLNQTNTLSPPQYR